MGVVASLADGKVVNLAEFEKEWTRRKPSLNILGLIVSLIAITLSHSKCTPSFAGGSDIVFYTVAVIKAALVPCSTVALLQLRCMRIQY